MRMNLCSKQFSDAETWSDTHNRDSYLLMEHSRNSDIGLRDLYSTITTTFSISKKNKMQEMTTRMLERHSKVSYSAMFASIFQKKS